MTTFITKGVGIWLLSQYVIGPVVVLFRHAIPGRYALPKLDWADLVTKLAKPFADLHRSIVNVGFVPCAATELSGTRAIMYVHCEDGSSAQLRYSASSCSVSISQRYVDGRCLFVSNGKLPSVFPTWEMRIGYRVPNIRDVESLFEKFRRIRQKIAIGRPLSAVAEAEFQSVESLLNAELEENVRQRFYAEKIINGRHRLTLKGAFLMSWRVAWPSNAIINLLAQRRAEEAAA